MDPTRVLVVYYSRTGTTDIVARAIREELGCEIEAIHDAKNRRGVLGYLRSSIDAALHRRARLLAMSSEPQDYDLLIVGTPIWNTSVCAPVRTYLFANRERIRRVAFFCTHRGGDTSWVMREMAEICEQCPVATLVLDADEVRGGRLAPKVRRFAFAVRASMNAAETRRRGVAYDLPPIA